MLGVTTPRELGVALALNTARFGEVSAWRVDVQGVTCPGTTGLPRRSTNEEVGAGHPLVLASGAIPKGNAKSTFVAVGCFSEQRAGVVGSRLATRPTLVWDSNEVWAAQCSYWEQRAAHASRPPGQIGLLVTAGLS